MPFEIPPAVSEGFLVSDSPRTYAGVNYYTPGAYTTVVAVQNTDNSWVRVATLDGPDEPKQLLVSGWDDPGDLTAYLVAETFAEVTTRYTLLSNRDWTTTHAYLLEFIEDPEYVIVSDHEAAAFRYRASDQLWTHVGTGLQVCATSASGRQFVSPPAVTSHIGDALLAVDDVGLDATVRSISVTEYLSLPVIASDLAEGGIATYWDPVDEKQWLVYRNADSGDYFGVELAPYPPAP